MRRDDGQVSILVVLAVSLFVLLFIGFGVDMTNLFFRRQTAQSAADAACVAGAMDMLVNLQGSGLGGFTTGTAFNCSGSSTQAPCKYAALNGYSSPGLGANTESNLVAVTFPTAVKGAVPPAASTGVTQAYIQVAVTDRVKLYFASLLSANQTQDVRAVSKCGMETVSSPVPILVLDPTDQTTLDVYGTPTVKVVGGPSRSIQVNSINAAAVNIQGAATVNLTQGGPNFNGSSFGVFGGPTSAPGGFRTANAGIWQSPAAPIMDPFAGVPPPPDPGTPKQLAPNNCKDSGIPCSVDYLKDGCPDPGGCVEFFPGDWSSINCKNKTCIFAPGVYYVGTGGLNLLANSMVYPTDITQSPGDGSMGTTFFMTCWDVATPGHCGSSGVAGTTIWANSGKKGGSTCPAPIGSFQCYATSNMACPGGPIPNANPPIPAYLTGNVFVGPCTVAADSPPSYHAAYDVPGSTTGPTRGMVFYSDRSGAGSDDFGGGGGLLMVGTVYVHNCPNSPFCVLPGPGATGDYHSSLGFGGNSGSGTYIYGYIVADTLNMHGTPTIAMYLNSSMTLNVLKVALLQ